MIIQYKTYKNKEVTPLIEAISDIRIEEFKNYPYLYIGNKSYEKEYFHGFTKDSRSCLVVAWQENKIIGIATGMPLKSEADILKETENLFLESGYDPAKFYYLGEFIVLKDYRGNGIVKTLEKYLIEQAKKWGFTNACLATVAREEDDRRKPKGYISSDQLWKKMGYAKIELSIQYHWPMASDDGKVADQLNQMDFWKKDIL